MTGVLLVNMGGALSREGNENFPVTHVYGSVYFPYNKFTRSILSFIISNTRYKKSWKKYELIGGTPIIRATQKTMSALQNELPDTFKVKVAFSYTLLHWCMKV